MQNNALRVHVFLLQMETSESPVHSQDREITAAVVSDENNNDVTTTGKGDDSEPDRESSNVPKITTTEAEADVCENVNVREMRKFFIEQGR